MVYLIFIPLTYIDTTYLSWKSRVLAPIKMHYGIYINGLYDIHTFGINTKSVFGTCLKVFTGSQVTGLKMLKMHFSIYKGNMK